MNLFREKKEFTLLTTDDNDDLRLIFRMSVSQTDQIWKPSNLPKFNDLARITSMLLREMLT